MNENAIIVRCEWLNTVLDIIHFFLQHSNIEFDGKTIQQKLNTMGQVDGRSHLILRLGPQLKIRSFRG